MRIKSELEKIPGIGKGMAHDLNELGINKIGQLRDRSPQELYNQLCSLRGCPIDRCVLYVFRSSVYYASNDVHDPELLKWLNWKD